MKTAYLAGPIFGCTPGEAKTWREQFSAAIAVYGVRGISPLRCEPEVSDRYLGTYDKHIFGSASAITAKNFFDVKNCDMFMAYFPKRESGREVSMGTLFEIAWAYCQQKPIIIVTEDDFVRNHPLVRTQCGWMLDTLDDAVDVIAGILGDYSRRIVA